MSSKAQFEALAEKQAYDAASPTDGHRRASIDPETGEVASAQKNVLRRDLKGRHMQMIAM